MTYYSGAAYGGAIDNNGGGMILTNDTIAANSVTAGGGNYPGYPAEGAGIAEGNNALSIIYNTIIANNTGAPDYNALSAITGLGGSDIIANPGSGTPGADASMAENPLLGPLANHGDGRLTYSLLPGSPALGAGNPSETYSEQLDGRGMPRFSSNGQVDIGAFEHQPYTVTNTNDSGSGSFRAAVTEDDDSSPIYFAPGLAGQTILLTSGPIQISRNITLTGPGANQLEIESAAGAATPLTPADLYTGSGSAVDSEGTANGTIQGGVTFATGILGTAFDLNGSNGFIAIPSSADVTGTGAFAVAAWVDTTSTAGGVIIQQRDPSNFNGEYQLAIVNGKVNWWDYGNNEYGFNLTSSASIASNQWYYVVAVRLANGTGEIFINGQLDSSQAAPAVPLGSGFGVYIGADVRNIYDGGSPEYFGGLIENVAIDHSAPTPVQIGQTYSLANGGRVFTIAQGVTATLTGLTIAGGVNATGGGIYNAGDLTIVDSTLSGNAAQGVATSLPGANGQGGAIYNAAGAVLTVTGSTFLDNSAVGVSSENSPVVTGAGHGGAIDNAAGAQLYLADDTFANNAASVVLRTSGGSPAGYGAFGGAIDNFGSAYILSTTIAQNTVTAPTVNGFSVAGAAGIENETGATLGLIDTIVANDAGGNDVSNLGTVAGNNNLVATSAGLPAGVVALTANPELEPLAYNGGSTLTLALEPSSPAVGTGSNAALLPTLPSGLADWWKAEGNALDSAGTSAGTIEGGVTFAPGIAGQAFQFNGTNAYIAVPPSADITGTSPFSIAVWIKTGSNGVIIQQRDASNFNGEYVLAVVGGRINFWDYGNSEYGFNMTSNEIVADNNWHFVVAVRQANGTGQIFIDGHLDSTQTGSWFPPVVTSISTLVPISATLMIISTA